MKPLDGIKVLDFTWALAGPYGTMILADMGAEVWKVEPVGMTERNRAPGPIVDGVNVYFFSVNRGKQSIEIDLKKAEGCELALQLAEQADVVTENFAPGAMKRLGLDYEAVRGRNPRIVYASTSGFGQTGPDAHRGAVDVIVQAASGLMSITGYPDGPPARAGYSIADMAAGMYTAIGVLGAIIERTTSGQGQYLDVSMLDAQLALLEGPLSRYFALGTMPGRIGSRHPLITPFQAFPTSDGYIVVANVKDWTLFCALMELDDLASDARFTTNELRTQHHADLEPLLAGAFVRKTTAAWITTLEGTCLAGPLNTIADVAQSQQALHRNAFVELPTASGGTMKGVNTPLKYSRTAVDVSVGADAPGGSTREILRRILGMDETQIEALGRAGVINA
jgi:CoA:oxalate CoA-transferase